MTAPTHPNRQPIVSRRPSDDLAVVSSLVALSPAVAFDCFFARINDWYQDGPHSWVDAERALGLHIEQRVGGQWIEVHGPGERDGVVVAEFVEWLPPRRARVRWLQHEGGHSTTVAFLFEPVGNSTRISVEHSGWSRLPAAISARGIHGVLRGWPTMLQWLVAWRSGAGRGHGRALVAEQSVREHGQRARQRAGGDAVEVAVEVALPPVPAFDAFTRRINAWWRSGPRHHFQAPWDGQLSFEQFPGGERRLVERLPGNGGTFEIGEVLRWEPGERLLMSWRLPNFAAHEVTYVDIRFVALARAGATRTQVTVAHSGWSRIRPDHPARHGLDDRAVAHAKASLWADQLMSLRQLLARVG